MPLFILLRSVPDAGGVSSYSTTDKSSLAAEMECRELQPLRAAPITETSILACALTAPNQSYACFFEQSIVGMQAVDNTFRPMIRYLSDRGL